MSAFKWDFLIIVLSFLYLGESVLGLYPTISCFGGSRYDPATSHGDAEFGTCHLPTISCQTLASPPKYTRSRLLLGNPHLNADIVVKFDSCDCKEKPMNNTKIPYIGTSTLGRRECKLQQPCAMSIRSQRLSISFKKYIEYFLHCTNLEDKFFVFVFWYLHLRWTIVALNNCVPKHYEI